MSFDLAQGYVNLAPASHLLPESDTAKQFFQEHHRGDRSPSRELDSGEFGEWISYKNQHGIKEAPWMSRTHA